MTHLYKIPDLNFKLTNDSMVLTILKYGVLLIFFCIKTSLYAQTEKKPNILIIYVDDLGYGDIGVNGAIGVTTPNVDKLARRGINFTDAHCSAATCTPSRYSLITGSYAFRGKASILPGDAPLIIDTEMRTLPDMLKDAGYATGMVGKWHLGLGNGNVDWNTRVAPGPKEVGFDYSFIIPATPDRVPTVFLEDQKVVGLDNNDPITISYDHQIKDGYPLGIEHPELLKLHADKQHSQSITRGISRIGFMKGGKAALWVDENIAFELTKKANAFIEKNSDRSFFLYLAFGDIHEPRAPNEKFTEASTMGPRGDAIAEMDWCVGEVMKKLEEKGLTENTLVIFSSDNGPILDDGYLDYARELVGDHNPGGPFKGSKYSIYEAGTRMPTVVSWPGTVAPGTSAALLSQVDLYASLAHLTGQELKDGDAPDSEDHLNAWLGNVGNARKRLYEEAYAEGIRFENYKYIHPKKDATVPEWIKLKFVDPGFSTVPLLFDLEHDPGETHNIAKDHPEMVAKMEAYLQEVHDAATRPGINK